MKKNLWKTIILRTGINIDQINSIKLDFFFLHRKKKSAAASSQLKLYNYVVKTGFFVHYQNLFSYFQQQPWPGLSHV